MGSMLATAGRSVNRAGRGTITKVRRVPACVLLLIAWLLGAPAVASAQLFFSTQPDSGFRIGPLILRAHVRAGEGPVDVDVLFGVVPPAQATPRSAPQDLFLLWPGELREAPGLGARDPAVAKAVEARGFDVIGEGRIALLTQSLAAQSGGAGPEAVRGGAPYATFVQSGGALGLSPPATWIRIPWTPRLVDRGWLMNLRFTTPSLVKPRPATWLEHTFLGQKYRFAIGFNEVRDRPLFAMYVDHRDRVVRLADAPAELIVNFADVGRLKIDEVYPPTSIRRLSESLESTEVVSLFLDTSEGIVPQQLAVQFGYFSRAQAAALFLVPTVLLALGYAIGPLLGRLAAHVGLLAAARLHVGGWNAMPRQRSSGVVLPRETLARIVPGETTVDQAIALGGPDYEMLERWPEPGRRTIVYRGQRVQPQTRRLFGWLSAVRHLEVERHEVVIEVDGEMVRDVHASVRRARLAAGEQPPP